MPSYNYMFYRCPHCKSYIKRIYKTHISRWISVCSKSNMAPSRCKYIIKKYR